MRARSKQAIFDTAVRHLYEQGRRSMNDVGKCLYRAPDGGKCAIGAQFPDKIYHADMENEDAQSILNNFPLVRPYLGGIAAAIPFLVRLQSAHDNTDNWNAEPFPRKALTEVAYRYNLKTTVLDALPVKPRVEA